jgi:superfamily II DNA or RNA helicase
MPRLLRSKRDRALLWYAAGGRCQQCGRPLLEAWHADHVVPWRLTHRTNVHEMQALCPSCNLQKGGRMPDEWKPRSFQKAFERLVRDLASGALPWRVLYCAITPGGGKGTLPPILTRLLPTIGDKLCWATPRVTLASQAEQVFVNKRLARLFPHTCRIRHDTNTPNPCRDLDGYTTTYQAIAANPQLHAQEFTRHRYILFLDEPHHLKTHFEQPEHPEFAWAQAIQPLVDRAAMVVYASGTLERHDQKPIFGMPYGRALDGYKIALPPEQTLLYRRQEALTEQAIVPLHFIVRDGTAAWRTSKGEEIARESFDETSLESGQMLDATLETEFARHLLADTVAHWRAHRQQYPQGKLLVVAPRIPLARRYASWLKSDHGLTVRIATSDDSKDAKAALDAFKGRTKPALEVLVTVGMAYEGLDVPDITHIACLTRYRSKPWLEQCFARAVRTAPGKQCGYIFAPDDPLLNQVVKAIRDEQDGLAKDIDPLDKPTGPTGPGGEDDGRILPLTSKATDLRAYDLQQSMTREETAHIALIMQQHGIVGISPLQMKRAFDAMDVRQPPAPPDRRDHEENTPTELEERYRTAIDDYTKSVDYAYFDGAWGSTNSEILRHGFLPRDAMSVPQLLQLWHWLQKTYPLGPLGEEEAI